MVLDYSKIQDLIKVMKQKPESDQPAKKLKTAFNQEFLAQVFKDSTIEGTSLVSVTDRRRDLKRKIKASWYECEHFPAVGTSLLLSVESDSVSVIGLTDRQHVLTRKFYGSHSKISKANVLVDSPEEPETKDLSPKKTLNVMKKPLKKKWKTHSTVVVELMPTALRGTFTV